MTYLKDFRARIEENDYPGFLKIWEEYCYNDEPDAPEIKTILEEMKNCDLVHQFGSHVERALSQWREIKDTAIADEILQLIVDIQTTNSIELFEIVFNHLKEKYGDDPHFHERIRIIGMRSRKDFQGAISHYKLLKHLAKGKFVFHTSGWGACEVIDVSLIREEVVLECDYVIGQKDSKKILSVAVYNHYKRLSSNLVDSNLSNAYSLLSLNALLFLFCFFISYFFSFF